MNGGLELPSSLRLEAGDTWQTRLPGLGSAGYDWQVDLGDTTVVEVDLQGIEPERSARPGGLATYNVDQLLTLRAVRAGTATVSLRQLRPWEKDESPLREHDISVVVE